MTDLPEPADTQLTGLESDDWIDRLEELAEEAGRFDPLGPDHQAAFISGGSTLLVTFEDVETIQRRPGAEPRGWRFVRDQGWSHLGIVAREEDWFRHRAIYGYFDQLTDEGFFDDFDRVLFFGIGGAGYAAAAYSVAAPGSRVLAVRPQATLDPALAGWDGRWPAARRLDFTGRYGFAPDMLDAAEGAQIVFTPQQRNDHIHAALFARSHVDLLRVPNVGGRLERQLDQAEVLDRAILQAMDGTLTPGAFAALIQPVRASATYWRAVAQRAIKSGHEQMAANLCAAAMQRFDDPWFGMRLKELAARDIHPARPVAPAAE